jgi:acyl-CoA synthetase (AMP-forming)/AMP-acid ligase II
VVDLLREQAATMPEKVAFTFVGDRGAEETLTFGELDRRARALAVTLAEVANPGDRALLIFPCGLEYIVSFFACVYADLVAVPLYPPMAPKHLPRVLSVVADCGATVALTTQATLGAMRRAGGEGPLACLSWICSDRADLALADEWPGSVATDDSVAFIQYTSGSTGVPKGVVLTHANLVANFEMISAAMEVRPDDVMVSWLPMYHDMGLIGAILHSVYAGIHTVTMDPSSIVRPLRWLSAISRHKGTVTVAPNFAFELCVARITPEELATLDLSSLRVAFNGAEPVRAEALREFERHFGPAGLRSDVFLTCYGLAEATLIVSGRDMRETTRVLRVDREALTQGTASPSTERATSQEIVSCGRACAPQRIAIVDPATQTALGAGAVGEIWVTGPNVARGYWSKSETSRGAFVEVDGQTYLRTGDLGFLDARGELFVTGRLKDLIIVRGKNIAPNDIEQVAQGVAPVLRARPSAAFAVQDGGTERVVLLQELKDGMGDDEQSALRRMIVDAIAEHCGVLPEVVLVKHASLPRTSSGKIQRHLVKAAFLGGKVEAA